MWLQAKPFPMSGAYTRLERIAMLRVGYGSVNERTVRCLRDGDSFLCIALRSFQRGGCIFEGAKRVWVVFDRALLWAVRTYCCALTKQGDASGSRSGVSSSSWPGSCVKRARRESLSVLRRNDQSRSHCLPFLQPRPAARRAPKRFRALTLKWMSSDHYEQKNGSAERKFSEVFELAQRKNLTPKHVTTENCDSPPTQPTPTC
jgi:hypothetical protein